ncbi:SA1788 family PVL leukocidin-associated protein [Staphylococcus auricularis]|uniref:SA1788 family PVL leukocidin-associated protein n=1 Tax=Staphylococcus auricularis TaxID=29379 RepID=A0AAW7M5I5_9STAP|nr:SA1788 family PVL leukocidin-associated protein [Staphylococcus auricularis]MDC6328242.1 SA1788 family PVL leukocidin-associated protein [Staphylococcus auricularis]MDN4532167.1 SA1788 family PVL leukocidin-associated protein [Staphylococcus auricularis]
MELARGRKVEIKNNQIYYVLMKNGEKIYLPVEAVHQAEKNGISWHTIWNRIHNLDHTVDQALTQSFTEKGVDDLIEEATLKRLHDEERERLARIEKRKEAKLREKKPYLFKVQQKHTRGKWCSYLMANDIFPKVNQ